MARRTHAASSVSRVASSRTNHSPDCGTNFAQQAISLHSYKAEMACCAKVVPQSGEWFVREDATLETDEAA